VTEGKAGQVIETLHVLAPGIYGRILPHVVERAVFNSESAEPGAGNLFEPIPEGNRLTGGWRKENTALRRTALAGGAALTGAGLLAGVGYALLRRN